MPMTDSPNFRAAMRYVLLIVGIGLSAFGLFGIGVYVAGVIEILVDQPADRSWLFWGLGVAGIGASLLAGGVALIVISRSMGNKTWSAEGPEHST
jgi:hypothetical protein